MFQHVNSVLVAKNAPAVTAQASALNVGDVVLLDKNGVKVTAFADAAKLKEAYVGVVIEKNGTDVSIKKSNLIQRNNLTMSVASYAAPVAAKTVINFATAEKPTPGARYVVRIGYKDIQDSFLFTHTYEVYPKTATTADFTKLIADKINAHANRRVEATNDATTVTLTAKDKLDSEGMNPKNNYQIVSMVVSIYTTGDGKAFVNAQMPFGAVVTTTEGNPGKGFWKQVRDEEERYAGYNGIVWEDGVYAPEVEKMVEKGAEYDAITLHYRNDAMGSNGVGVSSSPLCVQLYVKKVADFSLSAINKTITSFVTGVAASA